MKPFLEFTVNPETIREVIGDFDIDPEYFLSFESNRAVTDFDGNVGLFDNVKGGVYAAHYLFTDRGAKALKIAREMLRFFEKEVKPNVVMGVIPLNRLGARWMTRQLGLKSHGVVETLEGPAELFMKDSRCPA